VDRLTGSYIDIIPSRDRSDVAGYLRLFENLALVTRDGSPSYRAAVSDRSASVIQVADRFHLIAALTEALDKDLRGIIPHEIHFLDGKPVDVGEIRGDGRREANFEARKRLASRIAARYAETGNMASVAREFGLSRHTVGRYLSSGAPEDRKGGSSRLAHYAETIREWRAAGKSGREIHERIRTLGYTGGLKAVGKYCTHLARNRQLLDVRAISRKRLLKLLYDKGITDLFFPDETALVIAYIKEKALIGKILSLFTKMRIAFGGKDPERFKGLLDELAEAAELKNFQRAVRGVKNDEAAVDNSFGSEYTNGLVEGKICKIKQIKRAVYGRCSFGLLRQKLFLQNHVN
jgi:transposase-like protein